MPGNRGPRAGKTHGFFRIGLPRLFPDRSWGDRSLRERVHPER